MEVIRKLKEIYKVSYEILIDNRVDLVSASPQVSAKQTIQNSSLDEFATMLFSVAANLNNKSKLTTEEKLTKFEVYAKLAEAEREIANGDKGTDAFEFLDKLRGHYGR